MENSIKVDSCEVPVGAIVMWSTDMIPKGWGICDGNNNTPDLRDLFIVGAGKSYKLEDSGGKKEVTLKLDQMPSHSHNLNGLEKGIIGHNGNMSGVVERGTLSTDVQGGNQPHENRPPFFALYYIMKIKTKDTID